MKEVYQVLSGMLGQEQRINQIANNLANVNTVGFKRDRMAFQDYMKLAQQAEPGAEPGGGATPAANPAVMAWPMLTGAYTDFSMGSLQTTGQPLDVAIEGEGFFQVMDEASGELQFTRAGNFTLDGAGRIVTADGLPVLDEGGRAISLDTAQGAPQIGNDGGIRQAGAEVGRLGVVRFETPAALLKVGGTRFVAPDGVAPQPVAEPTVHAGALEGSNVNAIGEMVNMIEVQRAYDMNQKVMQAIDEVTRQRLDSANQ